jgi:hypothetical protein
LFFFSWYPATVKQIYSPSLTIMILKIFLYIIVGSVLLKGGLYLLTVGLGLLRVYGFDVPFSTGIFILAELPFSAFFKGGFWGITLGLAISLAFTDAAKAVLIAAEFVVMRISEFPKGPLIAIGIVLGLLVAILKPFS